MVSEQCCNCRFWEPLLDRMGQCRFNPPVVMNSVITMYHEDDADTDFEYLIPISTFFPGTHESEWCGKWEHRREESNVV